MSGFANPIIGGGGSLVYPSIHSPNYVAATSGWTINKDGSVEFNNGTFRGHIVGGDLFIYTGAPGLGNPPQFAAVAAGTTQDPYGNAVTSSKILVQANVITESAGILRTASAAPLIQLDGSHDAYLQYNAAAQLTETIAPVATSDGLGTTVQPGFTSYTPGTPSTFAGLIQGALVFGHSGTTVEPSIGGSGINMVVNSGQDATHTVEATLALISALTGGVGTVQLGPSSDTALELTNTSATPATVAGGPLAFGSGGQIRVVDGSDGNTYGTERKLSQVSPRSQSITSTTGVGIGGLSWPVVNGRTYIVRCRLIIEWNAAAGQPEMRFAGPAVSQMDVSFKSAQSGTAAYANTNTNELVSAAAGNGTGYNGTFVNITGVMTGAGIFFDVDIWGMFTFSANGTLTLQAATTVAADPWTVLSGFWEVLPL